MTGYERRFRIFAMALAALAGFVDAVAFVGTGGLFVSFMSGNSTRLAVASVDGSHLALLATALIASFVAGVVAGALIAPLRPARRKSLVLLISTLALCTAAALVTSGQISVAAMLLAFGMGALNNVFLREGEVSIGLTYMTGTLVRAGQRMAGAIRGQGPSDWLPYLLLWASLVAGAGAGAFTAVHDLPLGFWTAALWCAAMTVAAYPLEATRPALKP
ncbi:YoaK family protein [Novosphingobium sp. M1R2S20]|uniref:YoaK family protein n=1 Tax=Novosphingobium rhizovicinum TaxID=3228928 RepID=A0ABV3RFW1_9SPHN